MYSLPYFTESDQLRVLEFVRKNPFATICAADSKGRVVATQIPVLISEDQGKLILRGHMMKKTDHHLALLENPDALVLFQGPHTYVSASWYSDPNQASTWNYITVHARGKLRFLEEGELIDVLRDTTAFFEPDSTSPARFEHLSDEYIQKLIKAIIAFEVEIEEMENVFKLSQNRDEKSFVSITDRLQKQGGDAAEIASEMRIRQEELYANTNRPNDSNHN